MWNRISNAIFLILVCFSLPAIANEGWSPDGNHSPVAGSLPWKTQQNSLPIGIYTGQLQPGRAVTLVILEDPKTYQASFYYDAVEDPIHLSILKNQNGALNFSEDGIGDWMGHLTSGDRYEGSFTPTGKHVSIPFKLIFDPNQTGQYRYHLRFRQYFGTYKSELVKKGAGDDEDGDPGYTMQLLLKPSGRLWMQVQARYGKDLGGSVEFDGNKVAFDCFENDFSNSGWADPGNNADCHYSSHEHYGDWRWKKVSGQIKLTGEVAARPTPSPYSFDEKPADSQHEGAVGVTNKASLQNPLFAIADGVLRDGKVIPVAQAASLSASSPRSALNIRMVPRGGFADLSYVTGSDKLVDIGDVNGDGIDDYLERQPDYSGDYQSEGRVLVYFGIPGGGHESQPAWSARGGRRDAQFGLEASTAGDLNGDGYHDLVVLAPGQDVHDEQGAPHQIAFVYFGSAVGFGKKPDWVYTYNEYTFEDRWELGVGGDLNGDGYSDLVLADKGHFKLLLFNGSKRGLDPQPNWSFVYRKSSNELEEDKDIFLDCRGDINGDHINDLVLGVPDYEEKFSQEGRVAVFYGSKRSLSANPDWDILGQAPNAHLGKWIAANKAYDAGPGTDLVIGDVPRSDGNCLDLVFSSAHQALKIAPTPTPVSQAGVLLPIQWIGLPAGEKPKVYYCCDESFSGNILAIGDVKGNGYDDVLVGYDHVYYGGPSGLSSGPELQRIDSTDSDAETYDQTRTVAGGGDIRGDGHGCVAISACRCEGREEDGSSIIYVYYGSKDGLHTKPDWTYSDDDRDIIGDKMAFMDVDGDGYDDLLATNYGDDKRPFALYVFRGSASGLSKTPVKVSVEDVADYDRNIVRLGDVDDSGRPALLLNGYIYHGSKQGLIKAGKFYAADAGIRANGVGDLFRDGQECLAMGLVSELNLLHFKNDHSTEHPIWSLKAGQNMTKFGGGWALGPMDFNGDGIEDIAVAWPEYNAGKPETGRIEIHLGGQDGPHMPPDFIAQVDVEQAKLGNGMVAVDVNGDGVTDLVIDAASDENGKWCPGLILGRPTTKRGPMPLEMALAKLVQSLPAEGKLKAYAIQSTWAAQRKADRELLNGLKISEPELKDFLFAASQNLSGHLTFMRLKKAETPSGNLALADAGLNSNFNEYLARLDKNRGALLRQCQRTWIRYRDSLGELAKSLSTADSKKISLAVETALTQERTANLKAWIH